MNIGEPVRTIVVTPLREPVPEWRPDEEPVHREQPVLEPEKVGE